MMVGEIDGYNLIVSRFCYRGRSQWLSQVVAFLDGWWGVGAGVNIYSLSEIGGQNLSESGE
jgi:hypothetical protein